MGECFLLSRQGRGTVSGVTTPAPSLDGTHTPPHPVVLVTTFITTGLTRRVPKDAAGPGAEAFNH